MFIARLRDPGGPWKSRRPVSASRGCGIRWQTDSFPASNQRAAVTTFAPSFPPRITRSLSGAAWPGLLAIPALCSRHVPGEPLTSGHARHVSPSPRHTGRDRRRSVVRAALPRPQASAPCRRHDGADHRGAAHSTPDGVRLRGDEGPARPGAEHGPHAVRWGLRTVSLLGRLQAKPTCCDPPTVTARCVLVDHLLHQRRVRR